MDKFNVLKRYFGYDEFKKGQGELIDAILNGRDVLGVMPTGAGKSICYQVPAMLFDGITLVVSPLISLMRDQVLSLVEAGIPAAFLNSSLSARQYEVAMQRAAQGRYKIIYIAPERLLTHDFLRFAKHTDISLMAVDEAHCVSQWGQDFRPSYLNIPEFLEALPIRPVTGAFTATATGRVKNDIVKYLQLKDPLTITTGFDRSNLHLSVVRPKDKLAFLIDDLAHRRNKSGIVYCSTRKNVEAVCSELIRRGFRATRYHAGLSDDEREKNQEDFVYDRKNVMVATNAFGMGIDKSNVAFVYHYNMPKDIESFYQEAGRAGRDGEPADCILMFSQHDIVINEYIITRSGDDEADKTTRQNRIKNELARLECMVRYCNTHGCLRQYILNYFDEAHDGKCGNCSNCISALRQVDITDAAKRIVSCVAAVNERFGSGFKTGLYVNILLGRRDGRIANLRLYDLEEYAAMRAFSPESLMRIVNRLIELGLLTRSKMYSVLSVTAQAQARVFSGERFLMDEQTAPPKAAVNIKEKSPVLTAKYSEADADAKLLDELKKRRLAIAVREGVPVYIVFSNHTLVEMACKRPQTLEELLTVSGVGVAKMHKYGEKFLEILRQTKKN